jgi:hypothetical protein
MLATLEPQVEDFQSEKRKFVSGCEYAIPTVKFASGVNLSIQDLETLQRRVFVHINEIVNLAI